jgi:hypothetical protein
LARDVPPFDTRPKLSAACLDELRRQIALYGLGPVLYQIRAIEPHGRGRMKLSITAQRLGAMARRLAEDRDLPKGRGALTELARRAITDFPRPADFNQDGSVRQNAVRNLVDQFEVFCFDLDGRGPDGTKSNWS